jgi:glucosamine-6-phosphate deaminase
MTVAEHGRLACGFELWVGSDAAAVAAEAARWLVRDRLADAAASGLAPLPLGLATGRTMDPVYAALADQVRRLTPAQCRTLRSGWLSFNLDEYVGLGAADPRSFSAAMAGKLVAPLDLDPARVRLPDGLAADPATEACRYRAELAAAGGIGLQLLGLGLNGHVGFNEPPCPAAAPCRCVELSPLTRAQNAAAFGGDPAAVPARAITLGLDEILAARRILLVVTGSSKAAVLARLLREPPTPELPASWLQGHPAVTLLADPAALGGLDVSR